MKSINKVIQLLAIALNGAFIGAMVLIGLVLVPFWKGSDPQAFLDWFTAHGNSIGVLMVPLGPVVLVLEIVVFFLNKENRFLWLLAVVLTLANVLYFPIYFLPTNSSFQEQTIVINEVNTELSSWLSYHWQRVLFAFGALISSILAVYRNTITSYKDLVA